jgi:glycosyltransferase involved in cell wall biosynthesis
MNSSEKVVLHVTDCLNAGVGAGIAFTIKAAKSVSHMILWDTHGDAPKFDFKNDCQPIVEIAWKGNVFEKIIMLFRVVKKLKPDVIHAHSTLAGLLVRLLFGRKRIMYSPHCFSFQRLDLSIAPRVGLLIIEFLNSFKTSTYVCNWPNEMIISTRISKISRSKVIMVPLFDLEKLTHAEYSPKKMRSDFGIVGRIRPQKDPKFLIEVKNEYEGICGKEMVVNWLGSGDFNLQENLIENNVGIHPWVEPGQTSSFYKSIGSLVITSSWESGPLVLIEALNEGTPCILRMNSSTEAFGFNSSKSPSDLAKICVRSEQDEDFHRNLYFAQKALVIQAFSARQIKALYLEI